MPHLATRFHGMLRRPRLLQGNLWSVIDQARARLAEGDDAENFVLGVVLRSPQQRNPS